MENIICSICNSEYDEDVKIPRILTQCGHTFCEICISTLINNNTNTLICPIDKINYSEIINVKFPSNKMLLQLISLIKRKDNDS